jgi:hypothetical protein
MTTSLFRNFLSVVVSHFVHFFDFLFSQQEDNETKDGKTEENTRRKVLFFFFLKDVLFVTSLRRCLFHA